MSKYIDSEKLIAEIRELRSESCISESDEYYEIAKSEIIDIITYLQQEQPEPPTCKSCGFYENDCPFIRDKFIPYPNRVCKDYTYSVMKEQERPIGEEYAIEIGKGVHTLRVGSQSDIDHLIHQEKQEQPEGIDGAVHHFSSVHWIVLDEKKLAAALKEFPEGAKVKLFIFARKEDEK